MRSMLLRGVLVLVIKALLMGIPVFYEFDQWIGKQAGLHVSKLGGEPKRSDDDRLAMFRRLAWAQWTLDEISKGIPFLWMQKKPLESAIA